jgi:hypothetical protein
MDPTIPLIAGAVGLVLIVGMIVWVVRGVSVAKQVHCPAGEWTFVIRNYATGTSASFTLALTTRDGQPVSGTYRERKSLWIFPQAPTTGKLASTLHFHRDWINARYSVEFSPDSAVQVTFP